MIAIVFGLAFQVNTKCVFRFIESLSDRGRYITGNGLAGEDWFGQYSS
jgi:hypothetical protein